MESDEHIWREIATIVLKRSLRLHRGQSVLIDASSDTLMPAEVLSYEARRLGIIPSFLYTAEPPNKVSSKMNPEDATAIAPAEFAALGYCNGYVLIPASFEALGRRDHLPPGLREAYDQQSNEWVKTVARHSVPSVHLLATSVTESAARHFGVALRRWMLESVRASSIEPRVLRARTAPIRRRLERGRRLTIKHPNGSLLELGLLGRRPIIQDGTVSALDVAEGRPWTTLPSGQLVVALDEEVAEGRLISNRPSTHRRGEVQGVTWVFREGRLIHHKVARGRRLFEEVYRAAGPERIRPGVLTFGLNPEIEDFPMWEDLERGVVSLNIGYNNDFGGKTRGSFREYALLRGASVFVDGQLIVRGGRLL